MTTQTSRRTNRHTDKYIQADKLDGKQSTGYYYGLCWLTSWKVLAWALLPDELKVLAWALLADELESSGMGFAG